MGLGRCWAHPPSADLAHGATHELQRLGSCGARRPPREAGVGEDGRGSLRREFLEHQLAPLRQYSLPMWRPHPSPAVLADEDLAAVLQSLVGGDVARLEGAPMPLFLRDDWERVVKSIPVFNGDGPVPLEAPEEPVDVPSGDSSEEEEGGERGSRGLPSPGAGPAFSASLRMMATRMMTKTMMSRTAGARPRSRRRTGPG